MEKQNYNLDTSRVAILATSGFESSELSRPRDALREAGAEVVVVAPEGDTIQGMRHLESADEEPVDQLLEDAMADGFDALVLPGGLANPDSLRQDESAVRFIRAFAEAGKPIAAICHAPWLLIEAGIVRGREVTSWPSLKTDLENAGAVWLDKSVVVDEGIVTSRKPDDLDDFCAKMIEEIAEGQHAREQARKAG